MKPGYKDCDWGQPHVPHLWETADDTSAVTGLWRCAGRSLPGVRITVEPLIHSGLTDVLDEAHPLAYKTVYCDGSACTEMLHHCINENMQTWVEAPKGNYCLPCFTTLDEVESVDGWSGE